MLQRATAPDHALDRIAPGVWATTIEWIRARTTGPLDPGYRIRSGADALE